MTTDQENLYLDPDMVPNTQITIPDQTAARDNHASSFMTTVGVILTALFLGTA